ncbi:MAG TPA: hypothetical protein PL029_08965 [Bacteroidia bacterium]|nr:hypothetical protein [Bacteroidia bacterium]
MNRFTLSFFALCAIACCSAQNFYFKTEVTIDGVPAMFAKMGKSTTSFYQKGNKIKTASTTMNATQEVITVEDQVTITNKNDPKCVVITRAELVEDSLENDIRSTDVTVEKTTDTEKFLGYTCVKTIVRYKIDGFNYQSNYWCTTEIKVPDPGKKPLEYTKRNSLSAAVQQLEGFPLKTETTMAFNDMKTISTVTEVNTKEIDEAVFEPLTGLCKKPINLAAYKQELLRQKIEAKMLNNGNMYNSSGPRRR